MTHLHTAGKKTLSHSSAKFVQHPQTMNRQAKSYPNPLYPQWFRGSGSPHFSPAQNPEKKRLLRVGGLWLEHLETTAQKSEIDTSTRGERGPALHSHGKMMICTKTSHSCYFYTDLTPEITSPWSKEAGTME